MRRSDHLEGPNWQDLSPKYERGLSENETGPSSRMDKSVEEEIDGSLKPKASFHTSSNIVVSSILDSESTSKGMHRPYIGARAADSTRIMKFIKELSVTTVTLDRREGVLRRKRLEYLDCVAQFYEIPDTERSNEEICMLHQIAMDCPRTVPDVTFIQQDQVFEVLGANSLHLAIRHPSSGYVQGINDLVTPFLVAFLSEHFQGSIDSWSISDLSPEKISYLEADCYRCLTKLLDGMHDHYTFALPGIQRFVVKLKELVRRIDEPVSRHIEEQGLEFLQFAFRWFNCLLIREIPFHLVTRLWDTYLAEGDALPDFLVYFFASFLLTWSNEQLDFQEMVMFLQHLPTQNWTHIELEMVLSRAFMGHSMFNSSQSHLAS